MTTTPATAPTTSTKTTVITNLDAKPPVRATAGMGANGVVSRIVGVGSIPINAATTNLVRLVRIPSQAIVQSVKLILDAAPSTSLVGSLGLWFSDSTSDGTSPSNAGNLTAISSAFFMDSKTITTWNVASTTPFAPVDVTFANSAGTNYDGVYLPSQAVNPIWQAVYNSLVGLTTNATGAFTTASGQHYIGGGSTMGDPGGYFDIGYQESTTGVNTAAVNMLCIVDYIVA